MSTPQIRANQACIAIRKWAQAPSDDIADLETVWQQSYPDSPFYLPASDAIFRSFDKVLNYFIEFHGKLLNPSSSPFPKWIDLADDGDADDIEGATVSTPIVASSSNDQEDINVPATASSSDDEGATSIQPQCTSATIEGNTHARSIYVCKVANLHALLIAEGVTSKFSRAHCIDSLVCAAFIGKKDDDKGSTNPSTALPLRATTVFHDANDSVNGMPAAHLAAYAMATLSALSNYFLQLPQPLMQALDNFEHRSDYSVHGSEIRRTRMMLTFPQPASYDWTLSIGEIPEGTAYDKFGIHIAELDQQIRHRVERVYDKIIHMYRTFRGDFGPAGEFDEETALSCLTFLQPSCMDQFSSLFLSLVISSCTGSLMCSFPDDEEELHNPTVAPLREKDSNTTATSPAATVTDIAKITTDSQTSSATPSAGKKNKVNPIIPVPSVVRDAFLSNSGETFFFTFLTVTANTRLFTSLVPRLCLYLSSKLSMAAKARDDDEFTETVLEARLGAKLLSLILHLNNYCEDPVTKTAKKKRRTGHHLSAVELSYRTALVSAQLPIIIDLAKLIRDARNAGSRLAVIATISVAHVMLTFAHADPVARHTAWFGDAVTAVQETIRGDDCLVTMLCEEILDAIGARVPSSPKSLKNEWNLWQTRVASTAVGDVRFIAECMPHLDSIRAALLSDEYPFPDRRCKPVNPSPPTGTSTDTAGLDAALTTETKEERAMSLVVKGACRGIRELIVLAIAAEKDDPEEAGKKFMNAAKALVPDEPQTLLSVAAEWVKIKVKKKVENAKRMAASEEEQGTTV